MGISEHLPGKQPLARGEKETAKATPSSAGHRRNPIKAEVSKVYRSRESVPSVHPPPHPATVCGGAALG